MPLRNVATTFTIEQQRLEINALAGDVNNIATGVTNVGTAATANALAAGATGADLTLSGTLTVNGTQTILNTATLEVEDKNIVIAKGSTTDAAASGGGITLKGADDKTISYSQTGDKWVSNKNFEAPNLAYTSGGQTFSGDITIQTTSTDSADLLIGSTGTGEARIYLDASNGDFSGGDYAYFKQTDGATGGQLKIANMQSGGILFNVGEGAGGAGTALTLSNNGDATFDGNINLEEGKKTIFGSDSGNGAYIKHQSGHLEIKNETGWIYWDTVASIRIRTGSSYTEALSIGSGQDVQIPNGYLQIDPTDHDKLKLKVPSGSSDDWAYMTFWGEDGNRNAYIGTNAAGDVKVSRDGGCNLELGANAIFNGTVLPSADNTQDLGSSTLRWANVYTGDMHLNNMNSGGNDVDGSEGHWTMQEGADDLFLINRNTGKKYKFNLTEVS